MLKRRGAEGGESSIVKKWRGDENAMGSQCHAPFIRNSPICKSSDLCNVERTTTINEAVIPSSSDTSSTSWFIGRHGGAVDRASFVPFYNNGHRTGESSSLETGQNPASMSNPVHGDSKEDGGSLARLLQRRFHWSNRELPSTLKSAFHEVRIHKALSPCKLSPMPFAVRKEVDRNSAESSDVRPSRPTGDDADSGCYGNANITEFAMQPLQGSSNHRVMMDRFAASYLSVTQPDAMLTGSYSGSREALLTARDGVRSTSKEHSNDSRPAEKTLLPIRRYYHGNILSDTSSPYHAFSRIALPAAHPLWSRQYVGGLPIPSENWCALCKTSFRMTSDLVYHMRTYHKRDHTESTCGPRSRHDGTDARDNDVKKTRNVDDLGKKTRVEKILRCHVCQETFREKHHLTRHMTSHVR